MSRQYAGHWRTIAGFDIPDGERAAASAPGTYEDAYQECVSLGAGVPVELALGRPDLAAFGYHRATWAVIDWVAE